MSEDELLIAQLAITSNGYMNNKGFQESSMNENRVDWRRFIQPGQRPPMMPNQNYYQPPYHMGHPQQPQYPRNNGIPMEGDYGNVPSEVTAQISQLPMPRDEKGNLIIPPELQHLINPNVAPPQNIGLQVAGFDVPKFGVATSGVISEDKADLIMKEIKLLKRAINTLTNLVKKSILIESNLDEPKDISQPNSVKSEATDQL